MSAFQALASAASDAIAASAHPFDYKDINVQNLGPNPIFVEIGGVATVAGGSRVDAGGSMTFRRAPNQRVSVIAATADQVSPADTRIQVA